LTTLPLIYENTLNQSCERAKVLDPSPKM